MSKAISFEIVWAGRRRRGTGDRSGACNGSAGKGDLRWSRRPQPMQEVNTVSRSSSHEAPTRLDLMKSMREAAVRCANVSKAGPIKSNHNTHNSGSKPWCEHRYTLQSLAGGPRQIEFSGGT